MDLTPKIQCDSSLAVFIESYLQLVEETPNDLSKLISELREFKIREGPVMNQIELLTQHISQSDNKADVLKQIEILLHDKFKISDEKLEIADKINTLIHERLEEFKERNRPSIEEHKLKLQPCTDLCSTPIAPPEKVKGKRGRKPKKKILDESATSILADATPSSLMLLATTAVDVQLNAAPLKKAGSRKILVLKDFITKRPRKTRKRQFKKKPETDPETDEPESDTQKVVDEIEPVYCICRQVSFGQMIECEYESCSLEWFHFKCVGLKQIPKGKWYCPKCRGKKSNVISNLKKGLIA